MVHTMSLLQWNCNGFFKHIAEIRQLVSGYETAIICLQETNLKPGDRPTIRGFSCHRMDRAIVSQAAGGVAIFVRDDMFSEQLQLQTDLEAVAVCIPMPNMTTICNVYLPPGEPIDRVALEDLIQQLPQPFLLLGDFNPHHPTWGDPMSEE